MKERLPEGSSPFIRQLKSGYQQTKVKVPVIHNCCRRGVLEDHTKDGEFHILDRTDTQPGSK